MLAAELKSFHAVARLGSVTKAAQQLGVSQPTVTAQLRQLESRYGIELFHRQGHAWHLSRAGQDLMPSVEKLVQQEAEIDFRLRDARDLREGQLRIGATGPYYIMDTMKRYRTRYPGIELSLAIGNSRQVLRELQEYRIEIATSSVLVESRQLYRRTIAIDPMRVVVHKEHPLAQAENVTWQELAQHTLLLRETGSMTLDLTLRAMREAGVTPAHVLEIGSREAIHEAVLCQLGCSLMPSREIAHHPAVKSLGLAGKPVHVLEYLYCLQERCPAQAIARFLEMAPCAPGHEP